MRLLAGVTGLEPAASGVTGQRSNQLSYTPVLLTRPVHVLHAVAGCQAAFWRYGPFFDGLVMVGDDGLEPPTLSV